MAIRLRERIRQSAVYFRAAASVSKPIALLFVAFTALFIASLAVGIFLFGRWGYEKFIRVENSDPVVTSPQDSSPSPSSPADEGQSNGSSQQNPVSDPDKPKVTNTSTQPPIPNTGPNPTIYLLVFLIATMGHAGYTRISIKRRNI